MNADNNAQTRWAVSVTWRDSLMPNDAQVRDWITAIGDCQILLPTEPEPISGLHEITAQTVVEAPTLRQANTTGLGRVERAVYRKAIDVRTTLIRIGEPDEDVFAGHACTGTPHGHAQTPALAIVPCSE